MWGRQRVPVNKTLSDKNTFFLARSLFSPNNNNPKSKTKNITADSAARIPDKKRRAITLFLCECSCLLFSWARVQVPRPRVETGTLPTQLGNSAQAPLCCRCRLKPCIGEPRLEFTCSFARHMQVQNDGSMDTTTPHTSYFFYNDLMQHNDG